LSAAKRAHGIVEGLPDGARAEELAALRRHERTGRPLDSEVFAAKMGMLIGRGLQKKKPGGKAQEG
jgi:hypothetical protein